VGVRGFLVTADAERVATPRHSRTAEQPLQQAQQRGARPKQGSQRRHKAVAHCAKQHPPVRRRRGAFHHTTALALVRAYDTTYVEALHPAHLSSRPAPRPTRDGNRGDEQTGASRKAGLNKSMQDAGGGDFLSLLADKAAGAGKRVDAAPPASTAQDCSGGGERVQQSLSVRTPVCPHCGLVLHRDANAATNIQWRGQRLRGVLALAGAVNREPVGL
jgi:putative transposase